MAIESDTEFLLDLDAKETSGSRATETAEVTPVEKQIEPSAAIDDGADAQNEAETQIEEVEIENSAIDDAAEGEQGNVDEDFINFGLDDDDLNFSDVDDVPKRYVLNGKKIQIEVFSLL